MEEQNMANLHEISEDSFQAEVLESTDPVLVDFSATWCGPCKMLDPIIEELSQEWQGRVKFVKVDADQNPNIVMKYGVMGIPTLLFFKSGEIKERVTGYQPKDKLAARFSPHFN